MGNCERFIGNEIIFFHGSCVEIDIFIGEIGQSEGSCAGRVEYRCEKREGGGERRRAA